MLSFPSSPARQIGGLQVYRSNDLAEPGEPIAPGLAWGGLQPRDQVDQRVHAEALSRGADVLVIEPEPPARQGLRAAVRDE